MVDSILTPETSTCDIPTVMSEQQYFVVDNYFAELETEAQKGIARENLGVYGKQDLYTQVEVDNNIGKVVNDAIKELLAADDPHQILPKVANLLKDYVRLDGTTPFTAPQSGVDPVKDNHLTTKKYVLGLYENHLNRTDPHNVMDLVIEVLKQYTLKKDIYGKSELYTKSETNKLIKPFVKTDGTTPFVAPQGGVTPIADQHLTTKRYVDNLIFKHNIDTDPHGLLTILNQRLSNYYKTTETYSKAETYSRAQIDKVINTLVVDAANQSVKEHLRQFDPHNVLAEVYNKHYVKRDGSVPFTGIQKGIEGIEEDDLATVGQINRLERQLFDKFNNLQATWVTSGPVQTTVGFVEDESSVPQVMTFQEIMDAIFYGKVIDIKAPNTVAVGTSAEVTMYIRGNAMIEKAELYQNEVLIGTYDRENFLDWSLTVTSKPIVNNTTFTFIVTYINGQTQNINTVTNVSYGVFIGNVPKMCMPGDLQYHVMLDIVNSGNAAMYPVGSDVTSIEHTFNFISPNNPQKLVLAIPAEYNQLDYMHTVSQHFSRDAFNIETIPVMVPGIEEPILFTYYMYNESLVAFNSEVIFKLSKHE